MALRTLIEIDHRELHRLLDNPADFVALVRALHKEELGMALADAPPLSPPRYFGSGLYVLAQRDGDQPLRLDLK